MGSRATGNAISTHWSRTEKMAKTPSVRRSASKKDIWAIAIRECKAKTSVNRYAMAAADEVEARVEARTEIATSVKTKTEETGINIENNTVEAETITKTHTDRTKTENMNGRWAGVDDNFLYNKAKQNRGWKQG